MTAITRSAWVGRFKTIADPVAGPAKRGRYFQGVEAVSTHLPTYVCIVETLGSPNLRVATPNYPV
jgi:hypothetical protein